MGKRAVLFVNGRVDNDRQIKQMLKPTDTLVGVDGGADLIKKLGLMPQLIIGDLDSLKGRFANVPKIKFAKDKDKTDSQLALEWSIEEKYQEVLLVGFWGERFDHVISNLFLVTKLSLKMQISILADNQIMEIVSKDLVIAGYKGKTVSLIPIKEDCKVSTEGFKWELKSRTLKWGNSLGISNKMIGSKAKVKVEKGQLLVVKNLT